MAKVTHPITYEASIEREGSGGLFFYRITLRGFTDDTEDFLSRNEALIFLEDHGLPEDKAEQLLEEASKEGRAYWS